MSRKSKEVQVGDFDVTVREMRVKDIYACFDDLKKLTESDLSLELAQEKAGFILSKMTRDITPADLFELAPSELKVLLDAMKAVNADFFDAVGMIVDRSVTDTLKKSIKQDFANLFAGSRKQAMAHTSGTTAGQPSS